MPATSASEKFIAGVSEIMDRPVTHEDRIRNDLNATSMQCLMMIAIMEDQGAGQIEYAQFKKCITIADAIELMESRINHN